MTGERDVFSVNELVTTDNWYPKSQTCLQLVWVSARDVRNGFTFANHGSNIDYLYEAMSVLRKATTKTKISGLTFWLRFGSGF